ncbi:hypothetical protein MP638_000217 [Amoeboaphelidium occidentale]|nr:hypothetical protein MP638_000217 [Amoeboaphelidium occidentale]
MNQNAKISRALKANEELKAHIKSLVAVAKKQHAEISAVRYLLGAKQITSERLRNDMEHQK